MKSLTQEVVSAFETVHLLRCKTEDMDRCQANHGELIRQFYMVEDGIKADLAKRLDEVRNDWLYALFKHRPIFSSKLKSWR